MKKVVILSAGPGLQEIVDSYGHSSQWIPNILSNHKLEHDVKKVYELDDCSIDDGDAQGLIFTFNAGATVTPFSPVYLAEDNLVEEANASAIATMPCIGVSINTSDVTVGNPIEVMVMGLIRDDDFNFGTHGGAVYVSTTVGTMTSTAPSGEDNVVQVIGHSIEDDALFVQPCLTTIEHTG